MVGAGGTALAYVVHVDDAGRFGSVSASTTIFLVPAVAAVLEALLRSETVHQVAAVGAHLAARATDRSS